jgi:hypothetical protein
MRNLHQRCRSMRNLRQGGCRKQPLHMHPQATPRHINHLDTACLLNNNLDTLFLNNNLDTLFLLGNLARRQEWQLQLLVQQSLEWLEWPLLWVA